jgi:hypothetical protein
VPDGVFSFRLRAYFSGKNGRFAFFNQDFTPDPGPFTGAWAGESTKGYMIKSGGVFVFG